MRLPAVYPETNWISLADGCSAAALMPAMHIAGPRGANGSQGGCNTPSRAVFTKLCKPLKRILSRVLFILLPLSTATPLRMLRRGRPLQLLSATKRHQSVNVKRSILEWSERELSDGAKSSVSSRDEGRRRKLTLTKSAAAQFQDFRYQFKRGRLTLHDGEIYSLSCR
jgi:hypothetical protein